MKTLNLNNPTLSIIISTKDRFDYLRNCIESIHNLTELPNEIIIVDGSTQQDLKNEIEYLFLNSPSNMLRYIKSFPSLTVQNNIGIRNSSCDFITILDDDVILDKNYVFYVKEFFKKNSDPNVGALSTKILDKGNPNSEKYYSIGGLISRIFMLGHIGDGKFQCSGIPTQISRHCNEVKKVEFIYGGNATYPRHILEEFTFDENLPMGFMMSDDDLGYRISRKYQNYWTPKAFLYHKPHIIGNDRYSKTKQFVVTYFYLKKKNFNISIKNTLGFYWALIGRIILEVYFSAKFKNLSGVKGICDGFLYILKH